MLNPITISATGSVDLTTTPNRIPDTISATVVQVSGLTGSMTPQLRINTLGAPVTAPSKINTAYTNLATGAATAAGTPITADGLYEFATDGCVLSMNVTSLTGSCTVFVRPLVGAAPGGGTAAVQGAVASGSAASGENPVLVAGVNPSGNVQTVTTDASGNLRVAPSASASTEASTMTITTGGTAQSVFASNTARQFLAIENNSDTDMVFRLGASNATATVGFLCKANGGALAFSGPHVPSDAVTVFCATTGKAFYAVQG